MHLDVINNKFSPFLFSFIESLSFCLTAMVSSGNRIIGDHKKCIITQHLENILIVLLEMWTLWGGVNWVMTPAGLSAAVYWQCYGSGGRAEWQRRESYRNIGHTWRRPAAQLAVRWSSSNNAATATAGESHPLSTCLPAGCTVIFKWLCPILRWILMNNLNSQKRDSIILIFSFKGDCHIKLNFKVWWQLVNSWKVNYTEIFHE